MNYIFGSHKENIICPECNHIQEATVEYALPFNIFIHTCERCNYIIIESEWTTVEETKDE